MNLDYEIQRLRSLKKGSLTNAIHIESNVQEFCINCDQSLVYLTAGNPSLKPCCVMYLKFCSVVHFVNLQPSKMIRRVNADVPIETLYYLVDTYRSADGGNMASMPYTMEDVVAAFED